MSGKPEVIVMDYETALLDGTPSTEYYRKDFRIISAAFAWIGEDGRVVTKYREGEDAVRSYVHRIHGADIPLVVHNLQFEYGVTLYRCPGLESSVQIDTMRLVQVADNGGTRAHFEPKVQTYDDMLDAVEGDEDEPKQSSGLGLVSAASRWLPAEYQSHKEPFYALIRERTGCKAGSEGKRLDALKPDELERYNVADAVVTLQLYLRLTAQFREDKYDWRLDHMLYRESAKRIASAKGKGIPLDLQQLSYYRADIKKELEAIADKFRAHFLVPILELEQEACSRWIDGPKTARGKEGRAEAVKSEQFLFNVGSNKQLAALFVGKLRMEPKFTTKTGQPSFKSAFLSQWGEGGEMLKKRRKRLLVLKQVEALIELGSYDGKWHVDLKACGTTTGRFAGGKA
jgi:hypothetical protein